MPPAKDLVGKRFGFLTAIECVGKTKSGSLKWLCKCDCGNEVIVRSGALGSGNTKSCGCYQKQRAREAQTVHGETDTHLYWLWKNVKTRCYNRNSEKYYAYGARGIQMCSEWRDSYGVFRDWAYANGYAEGLTIDRIDVNGNYEPSNCRWATQKVQQNNRTNNRYITHAGRTRTLTQWSEETGISISTIKGRLNRGWRVEDALGERRSP